MKTLILIFLIMVLFSCSNNNKQEIIEDTQSVSKIESPERNEIDTILERNSLANLDLNKHQLFIDTTRNSKYFKQIVDWKPNEFDEQGVEYYFKEISKSLYPKKVDLKEFSGDWISIHSLNNEYVAYNPINGIDWRFTLTDSSVNHYRMEADADVISKVISLDQKELILELRSYTQKSKNQISYMRIKKTKVPYIFSIQNSDTLDFDKTKYINLVTPIENLDEFNLVVSDAPELVETPVKFDEIERQILE